MKQVETSSILPTYSKYLAIIILVSRSHRSVIARIRLQKTSSENEPSRAELGSIRHRNQGKLASKA